MVSNFDSFSLASREQVNSFLATIIPITDSDVPTGLLKQKGQLNIRVVLHWLAIRCLKTVDFNANEFETLLLTTT